jgi:hypothetical protein
MKAYLAGRCDFAELTLVYTMAAEVRQLHDEALSGDDGCYRQYPFRNVSWERKMPITFLVNYILRFISGTIIQDKFFRVV